MITILAHNDLGVDKTRNMEHSGTFRNMPEHEKIKIIFMKKKFKNSKYIKMGREEGGFQAFLTQPPLVNVCHAV